MRIAMVLATAASFLIAAVIAAVALLILDDPDKADALMCVLLFMASGGALYAGKDLVA